MNLPNTFVSSSFFMRTGDVLHVILRDETGTAPVIGLISVDEPDIPEAGTPLPPVIGEATNVLSTSFSANWSASDRATGYYLDVATDNTFTTFVSGFENKDVGDVITASVTGLSANTSYYYRVRAYNTIGSSKSSAFTSATTLETVTDGDGNVYSYVTIGTQQWLVENLKTTKYIDGTSIPNLTVDADWMTDNTGAYCWYNNDIANKNVYGALYNRYAAANAHGLTPTGWRIPSDSDWDALETTLGVNSGGRIKEVGTTHWNTPNTGATNESGFTALPGGERDSDGAFLNMFTLANFASTDLANPIRYFGRYTTNTITTIEPSNNNFTTGTSVRCMRDVV